MIAVQRRRTSAKLVRRGRSEVLGGLDRGVDEDLGHAQDRVGLEDAIAAGGALTVVDRRGEGVGPATGTDEGDEVGGSVAVGVCAGAAPGCPVAVKNVEHTGVAHADRPDGVHEPQGERGVGSRRLPPCGIAEERDVRQHALGPVWRRAVGFGHGWERRRSTLEAHHSALCACRRNQRGRYAEGDELLSPAAPVPVVVRGGLDAHRVEEQAPHQPLCVLTFQASSCDGRRGGIGDRLGRRRHPVKARVADSGARAARRCTRGA